VHETKHLTRPATDKDLGRQLNANTALDAERTKSSGRTRIHVVLDNPTGKFETLAQRPKIWSCRRKLELENDSAYSAREQQTEILKTRQRQTLERKTEPTMVHLQEKSRCDEKQAARGRHRENRFLGLLLPELTEPWRRPQRHEQKETRRPETMNRGRMIRSSTLRIESEQHKTRCKNIFFL
jgi:hypothetical protein